MEENQFDVIVIGSGPGGYPAAIKASQLGKKVALIEKGDLGGTCLNRGCIPSKALIAGAEVYDKIKKASDFGIQVDNCTFDYGKMIERKESVVLKMRKGIEGLIQANKITFFKGFGSFVSPHEVQVDGDKKIVLKADKIIIATGSESRNIPAFACDHEKILDSTDILNRKALPKSIAIVGGGVIGCEFASLFNTLGVKVTIIELLPSILPMEAPILSSTLSKAFQKKGIDLLVNTAVQTIEKTDNGIKVILPEGKSVEAEVALVAVGRVMNTSQIQLEKSGVKDDGKGNIVVNEKMQTNVPHIYAIGDIASKWWLAHVATHQGLVAATNACTDTEVHMHYNAIPNVIFTHPEIASCGLSLEEAKKQGIDASLGAFPFLALGKSQATLEADGFAQIIKDNKTNQIIGAQVVGYEASALIAEMAVAIANELTLECISETIHAHPTISEVWMEAALIGLETPLHLPPKRR